MSAAAVLDGSFRVVSLTAKGRSATTMLRCAKCWANGWVQPRLVVSEQRLALPALLAKIFGAEAMAGSIEIGLEQKQE